MKQDIVPADALEKEFYSFDVSNKEKEWIIKHAMQKQYIVCTHGTEAKNEYLREHPDCIKDNAHKRITNSTRFGYCTWCHHSFIVPKTWIIRKRQDDIFRYHTQKCPYCHKRHEFISGHRGLGNKSIKRLVTLFSRSRKSKDTILAKVVAAILPIENGYKDCQLQTYVVGMMRLEIGKPTAYYIRDVYYYDGEFRPYGIGGPWVRRKKIGYGLATLWENLGYTEEADYTSLYKIIQASAWKYCGCKEFFSSYRFPAYACNVEKYLDLYSRFPQIEILVKSGLADIVRTKLDDDYNGSTRPAVIWRQYKNPKNILRFTLTKDERKLIYELHQKGNDISMDAINLLAIQQQHKKRCTLSDAMNMAKNYWYIGEDLVKDPYLMDAHSLIAYCTRQLDKVREKDGDYQWKNVCVGDICRDYLDYYREIKKLGYDLTDRTYIRPRDLYEAHRHTSAVLRARETARIAAMREKEQKEKSIGLEERAKKLQSYIFTDGTFFIRPLRTAEEFIHEGSVNHNCVGTYITRCAKGHTAIMAIRKIDDPDTVFYTMEIMDNKIIQCRTKNNVPAEEDTDIGHFVKLFEETILKPKQELRREGA